MFSIDLSPSALIERGFHKKMLKFEWICYGNWQKGQLAAQLEPNGSIPISYIILCVFLDVLHMYLSEPIANINQDITVLLQTKI